MKALIRWLKGTLAVVALVAVGLPLRWMTDGAISGARSYDFESLTVLALGTIAWIAYGWLVLAVVVTVLEQLPGAIGALAGIVAGRVTSTTARSLLRSTLGVAAVTPLTVTVAHAAPTTAAAHAAPQSDPGSTAHLGHTTAWPSTEPPSSVHFRAPAQQHARSNLGLGGASSAAGRSDLRTDTPIPAAWRATELPSTVRLGTPPHGQEPPSSAAIGAPNSGRTGQVRAGSTTGTPTPAAWRATEPPSTMRLGTPPRGQESTTSGATAGSNAGTSGQVPAASTTGTAMPSGWRSTEPASTLHIGQPAHPAQTQSPTDGVNSQPPTPSPEGPTVSTRDHVPTAAGTDPRSSSSNHPDSAANEHPQADTRTAQKDLVSTNPQGNVGTHRSDAAARGLDGVPGTGDRGRRRVGVPDRPTAGAPTRYTDLRSGVPVRVPARVVVREGDSLWSIAARELGPAASAGAIAGRWPQWYAANRDVIGPDPDLILPGQVLRSPAAATGDHVPPTTQEQ